MTYDRSEIVQKLENAFSLGCTDLEACHLADISKATFYNIQNEIDGFLDRKEGLKKKSVIAARQSVIKGLKDDPHLAMKYLERKCKDEFGTKQAVENSYLDADGERMDAPVLKVEFVKSDINKDG